VKSGGVSFFVGVCKAISCVCLKFREQDSKNKMPAMAFTTAEPKSSEALTVIDSTPTLGFCLLKIQVLVTKFLRCCRYQ